MYAFENPWHVVILVVLIAATRVFFSLTQVMRAHRPAILELIDSLLIAVLLVFCILRPFVIQAFYIPSDSMVPTLVKGDRLLVNKFIYYFQDPKVGDIVVFDAPKQALNNDNLPFKKDYIKRVVGVPGDRLMVKNEMLYRNGAPAREPFINEEPRYTWPDDNAAETEITVPPGHIVVMGDNRNNSNDSHLWVDIEPDGSRVGNPFLPRANIRGKAMMIFLPPSRARLLK